MCTRRNLVNSFAIIQIHTIAPMVLIKFLKRQVWPTYRYLLLKDRTTRQYSQNVTTFHV